MEQTLGLAARRQTPLGCPPDQRSAETKKIAFVLPNLHAGGAERVAIRLMHGFRAAGHDVEFVLMKREGALLQDLPADVRVVDLGAARVRSALKPLTQYFRDTPPDAVQVRMWPLTVASIIARRRARAHSRLVVSDHAMMSKQLARQPIARALLGWSVRVFYPLADSRVVVARDAATDLARLSGLSGDRFTVIYNPVEEAPQTSPTANIDALWGNADGRIISVGTLKHQKNHSLLLRSFARVRRQRAARLMIVGSGPLEGELKQLAQSLGVVDDVIFTGLIIAPWAHYQTADLFVLSSDYEGYPNVMVEAMRCGLPVVSTDCDSGPREILDGGKYGALVPVGDEAALAEAILANLERKHDSTHIRARAEALSGAGTVQQYLDLLVGPKSAAATEVAKVH